MNDHRRRGWCQYLVQSNGEGGEIDYLSPNTLTLLSSVGQWCVEFLGCMLNIRLIIDEVC